MEQRAMYDEQGVIDAESDSLKEEQNWDEYWRLLFPKAAINSSDLPALRAFTHESHRKKAARKRKADTERAQSEQLKKELGLDKVNDLSTASKRRTASREAGFSSLISSLEQKYCNNTPAANKTKKTRKMKK